MRKLSLTSIFLFIVLAALALDNTYTKVTNKTQLSVGDKVVFAYNTNNAPDTVVSGFKMSNKNESGEPSISTAESDWKQFTISSLNDSAFVLCFMNSDTKTYLKGGKGKGFKSSTNDSTFFLRDSVPYLTLGLVDSKKWKYFDLAHNGTKNGNSNNDIYGFYNVSNRNTSGYRQFSIYKVTPSCSGLGQINGSVNLSHKNRL